MKTFKIIAIIFGVIVFVALISTSIRSCKENKDLRKINQSYVQDNDNLKESQKEFQRIKDSLSAFVKAKQRSADSIEAIKNHVERNLFDSKDKADRLLAENNRLKQRRDTLGLLTNCDSVVDELAVISNILPVYKQQNDSLTSAYKSLVATNNAAIALQDKNYKKLDSVYTRLYSYNQGLFSELQKANKKANKTVSVGLSLGYGIGTDLKPQPFAGITVTKALFKLW